MGGEHFLGILRYMDSFIVSFCTNLKAMPVAAFKHPVPLISEPVTEYHWELNEEISKQT